MAYFAEIDNNNFVTNVVIIEDKHTYNSLGEIDETYGKYYCKVLFKSELDWKLASQDGSVRVNYPGIGFTYNEELDAFVPQKPYDSWVLNPELANWEAPLPIPSSVIDENHRYVWNEEVVNWVLEPEEIELE